MTWAVGCKESLSVNLLENDLEENTEYTIDKYDEKLGRNEKIIKMLKEGKATGCVIL